MELSAPAEDCLLLVHRMSERREMPSTSSLARALGVTDSTVTAMLQKLARRELLHYETRKEISLTLAGQEVARRLIRRHRLIETYLWTHLGYAWDEVHAEAERLEHVVSDRFIEAINKLLGQPAIDPHGDPIPDAAGTEIHRDLVPLPEARPGQAGRIARIVNPSQETLAYLGRLGMYVGARVELVESPPHDTILHVLVEGRPVVLGRPLAAQVLIEKTLKR